MAVLLGASEVAVGVVACVCDRHAGKVSLTPLSQLRLHFIQAHFDVDFRTDASVPS